VLPAFCWRCCCSFRSCHLLCPCVCVCVCVLCNKCASLLLYNDVTKSTHKRQPRRHQCRSSMFWSCSPAPSTFNPPPSNMCLSVFRGSFSRESLGFLPPRKNESLEHLVLEFHRGYCAYFKSALPSVSPQSVNGVELCKFSSCRFSFLAAWIFRWPFSMCVVCCVNCHLNGFCGLEVHNESFEGINRFAYVSRRVER